MDQKPHIDYYFTTISSFAYLGHWAFQELIEQTGCTVSYKPMQLGKVFAASGGLGFGDRHPARLRTRKVELQRWRAKRGLDMNLDPKYFPTNPALADCAVIVLQNRGVDPASFMGEVMRCVWVKEQDIAQADTVAHALADCGLDAESVLSDARQQDTMDIYEINTTDGIALDIIGSPSPVYQGEAFWGQDRFELLQDAITTGRPPYEAG